MQKALAEQIKQIIENVGVGHDRESLQDNAPLGLDSIARLTLVVELENAFHLEMMDHTLGPDVFNTVATLTEFIAEKMEIDQADQGLKE